MGMRTYRGLLIATLAVSPWIAKYNAQGSTVPTCNGHAATVIGTSGPDSLWLNEDADGGLVGVGKAGNDLIHGSHDEDYWNFSYNAEACGWADNDTFDGVFKFIDGGGGFDTATIEACPGTVIKNVEKVVLIPCDGPDR